TRLVRVCGRGAGTAFRSGVVVVSAFLAQRLRYLAMARLERFLARRSQDTRQALQRARALAQILRSLATATVGSIALIRALDIFGWDVKPLIAGAGILGVAV